MLARLCQKFPHVAIDMFAPRWVAPLFAFMPQVAEVIDNPFTHGELGFAARRKFGRMLKANRYDQVIVLPNSLKSALVPFFADIPLRTGYRGEFRLGLLNDIRRLDEAKTPLMVERFAALAEDSRVALARPVAHPKLVFDETNRIDILRSFGLDQSKKLVASWDS